MASCCRVALAASGALSHLLCLFSLASTQVSSIRAARSNSLSQAFKALFHLSQLSALFSLLLLFYPGDLTEHHAKLCYLPSTQSTAVSVLNSPPGMLFGPPSPGRLLFSLRSPKQGLFPQCRVAPPSELIRASQTFLGSGSTQHTPLTRHFLGQGSGLILLLSAWRRVGAQHTLGLLLLLAHLVPNTVLYTLRDQEGNLFYGKKQKLAVR